MLLGCMTLSCLRTCGHRTTLTVTDCSTLLICGMQRDPNNEQGLFCGPPAKSERDKCTLPLLAVASPPGLPQFEDEPGRPAKRQCISLFYDDLDKMDKTIARIHAALDLGLTHCNRVVKNNAEVTLPGTPVVAVQTPPSLPVSSSISDDANFEPGQLEDEVCDSQV